MRAERFLATCLVLAVLFCCESPAPAQSPPAKPATLWQFLGIPQTFRRSYDGIVNRRGERPNLERKPPLKACGQRASWTIRRRSEDQATETQASEIKAIKYLAISEYSCYPGVKVAPGWTIARRGPLRGRRCLLQSRRQSVLALQSGDLLRPEGQGEAEGYGPGDGQQQLLQGALRSSPRRREHGPPRLRPDSDPGGGAEGEKRGTDRTERQGDGRGGAPGSGGAHAASSHADIPAGEEGLAGLQPGQPAIRKVRFTRFTRFARHPAR